MKIGDYIDKAEITHKKLYNKKRFVKKLVEMSIPEKYSTSKNKPIQYQSNLQTAISKKK